MHAMRYGRVCVPVTRSPNAGSMLVHRLQRWTNIQHTLGEHITRVPHSKHKTCVYHLYNVGPTLYKCYTHVFCLLGSDLTVHTERKWSGTLQGIATRTIESSVLCRQADGVSSAKLTTTTTKLTCLPQPERGRPRLSPWSGSVVVAAAQLAGINPVLSFLGFLGSIYGLSAQLL